jgi:hypothetical protein
MGGKVSKPVHAQKPVVYKQKLPAKYLNKKRLTRNQYAQDYKLLHTADGASTVFGKNNNPIHSNPVVQVDPPYPVAQEVPTYQVTENHLWIQMNQSKAGVRICDLRSGSVLAVEWQNKIKASDKFANARDDVAAVFNESRVEDEPHFFLPQKVKYGFAKDISRNSEFWVNYAIEMTGMMDVFEPIYHQSGLLKCVIQDEKTVIATKIPFKSDDHTTIGPDDFFRTSAHQVLVGKRCQGIVLAEIKDDEIHIPDTKPIIELKNKFYMHPSPARNAVILDVYRHLPSRGRFDYRIEFAEFQFISLINEKWEKLTPSWMVARDLNKLTFVKWLLDSEQFVMKDKKDVYSVYSIANNIISFVKKLQLSEAQQIMEEGIVVTSAIVEDSRQQQVLQLTGVPLVNDDCEDVSSVLKEILTAPAVVMPDELLNIINDYRPHFPNMRFFPQMPLDVKTEETATAVIPVQKGLKTL